MNEWRCTKDREFLPPASQTCSLLLKPLRCCNRIRVKRVQQGRRAATSLLCFKRAFMAGKMSTLVRQSAMMIVIFDRR